MNHPNVKDFITNPANTKSRVNKDFEIDCPYNPQDSPNSGLIELNIFYDAIKKLDFTKPPEVIIAQINDLEVRVK